MNEVETQFNALYQKTLAFYENAMNGDKTHPFVLFKIKQLKLKKSNFKKVKNIDNDLLASALRIILLEDLQTFVEDVKEYEMKMRAKKSVKPIQQNRKPHNAPMRQQRFTKPPQANTTYKKHDTKPESSKSAEPVKPVKQPKSNQKYLKSMNFKNNSFKKKGQR